ncbi:MAG: 4-(cytidine 5'-diphospho)-2-C-methyl-D-erythritol kinase [Syntrophobacterales bacterium]|jgi:4-diphosphocytidyl-2-C-methyl-D-erythritol kinase|nr:4-(cytidine 5'-diphospho)-2-C-methyl-D-erythritol kinase [Syntrophobacterales bacterium]
MLCPAKVNLYLRIVGRRPDGYHDLVTVMQPLTLADELTVTPGGEDINLTCEAAELPQGEENLVWRAAARFREETGQQFGMRLGLRKKIPVAAGLGGGSSDAAGTLLVLNELAGRPLTDAALHRLAASLGADVPFFLRREPAVGRGIGTQLSPVTLKPYWYLLINPGVALSTRWVYENLDLTALPDPPAQEAWDPEHPETWVRNDLGGVALRRFPELAGILADLKEFGARAQGISGSGPTLFGLFPTSEAARQAGLRLRRTFSGWLAVARGLTGTEPETTWENHVWTI